ncbi:hypothetical protein [Blautia obeum]|uniref:Uncharacterized protein n=1 Tax=Blautia obeum TaxID=40520 RepID=A0A3E5A5B6_9FIRM|nr:hypothetical protein [Blautia obeum]RGN03798.1 hypothetical protein DXB81_11660 [Blautia obeum]
MREQPVLKENFSNAEFRQWLIEEHIWEAEQQMEAMRINDIAYPEGLGVPYEQFMERVRREGLDR